MIIYDSELNPYSSIDDYTLDGLYTPIVNVEKQKEDKGPKKVTVDAKPKRDDAKNSLDSKDVFINPDDVVSSTSVSSKETTSESVKAPEKLDKEEAEDLSGDKEIEAEKLSEGVEEAPKKRRGRPRKVDVEAAKDSE